MRGYFQKQSLFLDTPLNGCYLPIAATRLRARIRPCGICGGQSGTGAVLGVVRFTPPIIPPAARSHGHPSSGAGTISQIVADVPSGHSRTLPQEIKKKKTHLNIVLQNKVLKCISQAP
jgi:hypothetical protein